MDTEYVDGHRDNKAHLQSELSASFPELEIIRIEQLVLAGKSIEPPPMFKPSPGEDPVITVSYTSGSTGIPKGVIERESSARRWLTRPVEEPIPVLPFISLIYLPLGHGMVNGFLFQCFTQGGAIYFTVRDDLSTLYEDLKIVRPTILQLIPRITEGIYQHYQTELIRRPAEAESKILEEMKESFLGNRLLLTTSSSAPTTPVAKDFFERCFKVPLVEKYGLTDAGIITVWDRIFRNHVIDYKIIDVPELGYFTSDKPFPRGELYVKTEDSIEYFKNPNFSEESRDAQGYFKTGDIFEERGIDHITWIDRRKNIIKLSQGEFVGISKLEATFSGGGKFIKQIYIYGNSTRSYLLAVIVPEMLAIRSHFQQNSIAENTDEIHRLLHFEIAQIAKEAKLRTIEIPKEFIVELIPFSIKNGLLTGLNKPIRKNLKLKYGEELESIYSEIESSQVTQIAEFKSSSKSVPVEERVKKAIRAVLALAEIDFDKHHFFELGGDSMRATLLGLLIDDTCGVYVPPSIIMNPAGTLNDIIRFVEANREIDLFHKIHPNGKIEIKSCELKIEKFLDLEKINEPSQFGRLDHSQPKNFLITGSNGFLGRFLTLEFLRKASERQGKVYCIVRAKDDVSALDRVLSTANSDPSFRDELRRLAKNGLVVFSGDLARPNFGLPSEKYDLLANEIDHVIHSGALVNHSMTYRQLFEPNVLGSVEVIKLALTKKIKKISYISTFAVLSYLDNPTKIKEDADVRRLYEKWKTGKLLSAEGYTISKWAAEVLMLEAYEKYHVPVNVFRVCMLLPHSTYRGQINSPDYLTRLIYSLIYSGIAPKSFYKLQPKNTKSNAHFNGLPVDFLAKAIASIADVKSKGFQTYQMCNSNWEDQISLDMFSSWIEKAGYPIDRIENYNTWYTAFEKKLLELTDKQRNLSSFPIIDQWKEPSALENDSFMDGTNFQQKLEATLSEPIIPTVTQEFFNKYLRDMQELKLIDPPNRP